MAVMFVVPVAPYAHATPNRKNADENAPSRKYFIAASFEFRRPGDARQDVEGQRQDLEGQEHEDEVGRGRDQRHPGRGEQDERIELPAERVAGPCEVVRAQ